MKKPLRKRIADAVKVLKGEPLLIDVPITQFEILHREVKTIAARHIYPPSCLAPNIPKEVLRQRAEMWLSEEIARCLLREGVVQFREDDGESELSARVRVVMPAEGE